jgi:hypothetical protein
MFEGPVYSREKNSRVFGQDKQVRTKAGSLGEVQKRLSRLSVKKNNLESIFRFRVARARDPLGSTNQTSKY